MTNTFQIVLLIHLFSTIFMTGLCWFVQIVHYPLFRAMKLEDLPQYEQKNKVTGYVTVTVMTVELITALVLVYQQFELLYILNIIFLALIWLSTMVYQVPMHLKLMIVASNETISKLIRTNWIRTLGWTVRSGILLIILWELL